MNNEEMKNWFLNKFEENFEQEINFEDDFIKDTNDLEKNLKSNFKFNDDDKKYLKKEYTDQEISKAEKETQRLIEIASINDWKEKYLQSSKTDFNFSTIDWENLDEYDMYDMKKSLELNEREAAAFESIWTVRNTHYHCGKNGAKEISEIVHHLSLKSLKGVVDLVEKFPQYERFNKSLLEEVHKIIDDEEFTKKYDLDYIDKQKGISKRVKNATKKIKDLETGIVYKSTKECAEAIGKSSSFISKHKDRFETIK